MSGSTGNAVECPICGEGFDPTAAGGWCTNPNCGEWRTEESDVPRDEVSLSDDSNEPSTGEPPGERDGDGGSDAETGAEADARATSANGGNAPRADDDGTPRADDPEHAVPAGSGVDDGSTESVETGHDASHDSVAAEARATEEERPGPDDTPDDDGTPDSDDTPDGDGTPDSDSTVEVDGTTDGAAQTSVPDGPVCPDCGTDVDEDDNFCADCGRELPDFDADALSACPACEADVDEDDNFCANCGEDLDAHRSAGGKTPAGAAQSSDDAAAAQSDGDATAVGGERSDTESAGGGTTESGEDGGDTDQPSTLLLKARGREISVTDGDTVGREVRSLITDTGGEEDEAVRVHREHVRFVREDGQFYVVDLGENPTRLNGRSLRQGDREPVVPGNELELSGVVTLTVARP